MSKKETFHCTKCGKNWQGHQGDEENTIAEKGYYNILCRNCWYDVHDPKNQLSIHMKLPKDVIPPKHKKI